MFKDIQELAWLKSVPQKPEPIVISQPSAATTKAKALLDQKKDLLNLKLDYNQKVLDAETAARLERRANAERFQKPIGSKICMGESEYVAPDFGDNGY